jgi:hypothetical protein
MIRRTQWEQAGYTIAEHTTSPPVDVTELDAVVIHYPAHAGPIGTGSFTTYTQNLQRSYVDHRGYSVGYSWLYWPDGTEVELRGYDYRNAANAVPDDPRANRRTLALLVVVDGQNPATAAQVAAIRARRHEINRRTGRRIPSTRHRDLEPTVCPGAGLADQQAAGLFEPDPDPESDDDMNAYLIPPPPERKNGRWLVCTVAGYRLANSHDIADNMPRRPFTDAYRVQQYDEALAVASNRQVPA